MCKDVPFLQFLSIFSCVFCLGSVVNVFVICVLPLLFCVCSCEFVCRCAFRSRSCLRFFTITPLIKVEKVCKYAVDEFDGA